MNTMLRRLLSFGYLALCAVALFGCQRAVHFEGTDITGADFGRDFHLVDHNGTPRSLADFRGKVMVMFFGYTHCPDVCPTTLSDLAATMRALGSDAGKVQVLFVTIDPERDTPTLLRNYVPAFNPAFLGLYGDAATTAATAKEYKVFYQKEPGKHAGDYSMDHSAGTYVYDPQGRLRLFFSYGQRPEAFAHDIRLLLG